MHTVKSGIGFGSYQPEKQSMAQKYLTSRAARVLLAGAGFLADAYDLFVINLVLRLLRDEYPQYGASGRLHALEGAVASAALFGAIIGQLVAGSLADIIGRKKIFVTTAAMIIVGCLGAAMAFDSERVSIYTVVACWRALLGMGVGGEYPLAATVTSESSSAGRRGTLMAAVFSMQGFGSLLSVIVVVVCLFLGFSPGFTWRFALAFGATPVLLALPFRMQMHETESFERIKESRRHGHSHRSEMSYAFNHYKWHLLGTALSWFLLDVDFYANGLFNHDVTSIVLNGGQKVSALKDACNAAFICVLGLPGYWAAVLCLERFGRKNIQMFGFIAISILYLICGYGRSWFLADLVAARQAGLHPSPGPRQYLFLLVYGLTFFFSNFGPNTTTFIIPGEIYPSEVRATCHGLSAASGKLGAAAGAYFFPIVLGTGAASEAGLRQCMAICSIIALLGAIVTFLFIPTYDGVTLDTTSYLSLDFECLQPSKEQLSLLRHNDASAYKMVHAVQGISEYGMEEPQE